jgi:hypothetical protein
MRNILSVLIVAQLLPSMWLVSWLFAPGPDWTWQWVPAVASQVVLYSVNAFAAFKAIKSLRRSVNGLVGNSRKR